MFHLSLPFIDDWRRLGLFSSYKSGRKTVPNFNKILGERSERIVVLCRIRPYYGMTLKHLPFAEADDRISEVHIGTTFYQYGTNMTKDLYCIGVNSFQDYLREQPDNMKSFNIVAETAQFLNLVYSNVNPQNIDLVIQLYETLNEFTVVRMPVNSVQQTVHARHCNIAVFDMPRYTNSRKVNACNTHTHTHTV